MTDTTRRQRNAAVSRSKPCPKLTAHPADIAVPHESLSLQRVRAAHDYEHPGASVRDRKGPMPFSALERPGKMPALSFWDAWRRRMGPPEGASLRLARVRLHGPIQKPASTAHETSSSHDWRGDPVRPPAGHVYRHERSSLSQATMRPHMEDGVPHDEAPSPPVAFTGVTGRYET